MNNIISDERMPDGQTVERGYGNFWSRNARNEIREVVEKICKNFFGLT